LYLVAVLGGGFGLVSVAVGVSPAKLTFFRGAGVTVGFSSGRLSVDGGGASLTGVKPTSILALLCFGRVDVDAARGLPFTADSGYGGAGALLLSASAVRIAACAAAEQSRSK
jgi:hypothetical protein